MDAIRAMVSSAHPGLPPACGNSCLKPNGEDSDSGRAHTRWETATWALSPPGGTPCAWPLPCQPA